MIHHRPSAAQAKTFEKKSLTWACGVWYHHQPFSRGIPAAAEAAPGAARKKVVDAAWPHLVTSLSRFGEEGPGRSERGVCSLKRFRHKRTTFRLGRDVMD
jgi:hypothetical protein